MAGVAGGVTVTFGGTAYTVTGISVKDSQDTLDVTTLSDTTSRNLINAPFKQAAEATIDFFGVGPRARATGAFSAPGVSGLVGTVVSSSVTLAVNEPVRSQATIQFRR